MQNKNKSVANTSQECTLLIRMAQQFLHLKIVYSKQTENNQIRLMITEPNLTGRIRSQRKRIIWPSSITEILIRPGIRVQILYIRINSDDHQHIYSETGHIFLSP